MIMRGTKFFSSVWIFYLLIIFEILFMISPVALYYYSAYGPVLNTIHSLPGVSSLIDFFMPHFSESDVWLFNNLFPVGALIFLVGLLLFLIGAFQIYNAKFRKKGAVIGGLYRYVRHPQYSAFFIMGLGTLLIWPRIFILFTYITMVFVYYVLARKEERDCLTKFGNSYQDYFENTAMFFPGDSIITHKLSSLGLPVATRRIIALVVYILTVVVFVNLAFVIRDYSIGTISVLAEKESATISTVKMEDEMIIDLLNLAVSDPLVDSVVHKVYYVEKQKFLNYIVPAEWILPDLPLDDGMTSRRGHQQPENYNRDLFKILFTRSLMRNSSDWGGVDIIKNTIKRKPLFVVYVDRKKRSVTEIRTAPETVLWGDIPTPLF
jgi:protein-S-isoprenylcysteine O-methyltransferase Ste14